MHGHPVTLSLTDGSPLCKAHVRKETRQRLTDSECLLTLIVACLDATSLPMATLITVSGLLPHPPMTLLVDDYSAEHRGATLTGLVTVV